MTDPLAPVPTDREVDRLPVDAGLDDLLVGLLDTPEGRRLDDRPAVAGGRAPRRRWPAVVAGAAAVALVAAVPAYVAHRPGGGHDETRRTPVASSGPTTVPTTGPTTGPTTTQVWGPTRYAVLDAPGWSVEPTSVVSIVQRGVTVAYTDGSISHYLDLQWLVRGLDRDYVAEATRLLGPPETVVVLGTHADLWEDRGTSLAYLPVDAGFGLRIRARGVHGAAFRELLADLRPVAPTDFAAALPRDVVTPSGAGAFTASALVGAASPDGYEATSLVGYNAPAQAAGVLAADLGCAWAHQFVAARRDGRMPDVLAAVGALRSSTSWRLVRTLRDRGYYHRTVQAMVDDEPDRQVLGTLGC